MLLQGIFPSQGSNLGLPHYRQMLYRLSHQERGFTVFHSECTNLHSHQHSQRFPFLCILNSICFLIFLIIAFPIDVRCYLTVFDLPFLINDAGLPIGHQYVCSYALPIFQFDCFFFSIELYEFFFFLFFFIFKLYNIVLVLPNIEMNPTQVYPRSPS